MMREAILQSVPEGDDAERALRPQRMADMVGQRDVYERLQIALDAARKRKEALGHVLFDGPPGLGKTTFAAWLTPVYDNAGNMTTAPKPSSLGSGYACAYDAWQRLVGGDIGCGR